MSSFSGKSKSEVSRPNTGRINTLGLNSRELNQVMDEMDAAGKGASPERNFVRWSFRKTSVIFEVTQPGGTKAKLLVPVRNISCGGMSILHSAYMHTGTSCVLYIPSPENEYHGVRGFVTRCRHVKGTIHELGIQFSEPINARDFVELDEFSDCFSLEKVDPQELEGRILIVDDSEMDLKLAKHYLRDTNLRISAYSDPIEALDVAEEGVDLILLDYDMPEMNGHEWITKIRENGIQTGVIMVTSDTSTLTRQHLASVQANAFLAKPITQEILLRAIAEFLMVGMATGPMKSTLDDDDPNRSLVPSFIKHCRSYAKRLHEAVKREDNDAVRSISLQIRGAAPAVGFTQLATQAELTLKTITASMSVSESICEIKGLIALLERVKD